MNKITPNDSFQRKTTIEIIERIFNALEDGKFHTISEVASIAKSNWRTVKNQVDLIKKIQEMSKIEVVHASKQVLVRKF